MSYPVVGEELVHYLPHLGLLAVQDGGAEVEAHVEHGGLVSQRRAAMLRERVRRHLVDGKGSAL